MKNTFVKVLSLLMALMMFAGVFGTMSVFAADCTHENTTEKVVDPSCESAGFTKVICNDCGEESVKKGSIIPATGEHVWKTIDQTEPTCTKPAYKAYKECEVCGKTEGKDVAVEGSKPNGHAYNIPVSFAGDCQNEGYTSKKCAVCGDIDKGANYTVTAPAKHDFVYTVVTPATACLNGTYKVTCTRCDYIGEIHDADKHHTPVKVYYGEVELAGEGKVKVGAGCGATYKELEYCSTCKVKISAEANEDFGHRNWDFVTLKANGSYYGTLTSDDINQQIIDDTGLNMGDHIWVYETCTTDGYDLRYCHDCGHYWLGIYPKLIDQNKGEHYWYQTGVRYGADHTQNSYKLFACSMCNATKEESMNDATPHNYSEDKNGYDVEFVKKMTCTSNGYTRHTCNICGYYYDDAIVYATGHTFDNNWQYTNCIGGTMSRTCINEHCTKVGHIETKPSDRTKHDFEVVTTPATCQDNAFSENVCKVCKFNAGTEGVEQPAAGKNPANHVIKDMQLDYAGSSVDKRLEVVQQRTCVLPEISKWACACGQMVTVKSAEPTGHNIVEGVRKVFNPGTASEFVRDFRELDSTCKTPGQKAGKFCLTCGHIDTAPIPKALDPKVHEGNGNIVGDLVPATCVSVDLYRVYWSCCGDIIPTEVGDSKNPYNHPNAVKTNEVPATCLTTGMKAYYYCPDCKVFMTVQGDTYNAASAKATLAELNLIIPMLSDKADRTKGEHNWNKAVAAVAEQCTVAGTKSYQTCKDCAAWLVDGVVVFDDAATKDVNEQLAAINIPAHGSEYVTNLYYMNGKNDCHNGAYMGIPDALLCSKCGTNGNDGVSFHAEFWKNPTAHAPALIYSQNTGADCKKATFDVVECTICHDVWALHYNDAAVKAEHVYTNEKGEYLIKVGTTPPDCLNAGYDTYKCVNCPVTTNVTTKAALGHHHAVNGVKMPLSFDCATYETYKGLTCVDGCGKTVNEATRAHTHVTEKFDATCTEDGWHVEYCADCDKVFSATTYDKKGHSTNSVHISTVDGIATYNCDVCGEYWTKEIIPAIDVTVNASAENVAAGETFTVTYALSGNTLTFSALNLKVVYDQSKATLTGIDTDIDGLYTVVAANGGISLVVANNADGEAQKVTTSAEGTVLFTMTFVANQTATTGKTTISVYDVDAKLATANDTVKVTAIGNLNGDTIVSAEDAQAIFAYIGTNNVAADVNLDGVVTLADVIALAKFAASNKTVADYFEMVGELEKLDDEVFALYEAGRINDVNNDGVANIADAYALISEIEYAMNYQYSALGNIVTMAELVALANKNA